MIDTLKLIINQFDGDIVATIKSIAKKKELLSIKNWLKEQPGKNYAQKIYNLIHDIETPLCEVCNKKEAIFINVNHGYRRVCSQKCSSNSQWVKDKTRNTVKEKYGSDYYFQTSDFRQQFEDAMLNNYGVKHNFQAEECILKREQTWMNNYGVKHISKSDIIKDKKIKTNKDKHGVDYYFQSAEFKTNYVAHFLKNFGVRNGAQTGNQRRKFSSSYKKFILPSEKEIYLQGYEPTALKILLSQYSENEIIYEKALVPEIWYRNNSKRYFVDFFIPSKNLMIEVKSTWTYEKGIISNMEKARASIEAGYNYEFWICSKTELIEIIKI